MLHRSPVSDEVLGLADRTKTKYEVVDIIVDIVEAAHGLRLCVQWEGLLYKRDLTWASLNMMYEVILDMFVDFIERFGKKKIAATAAHHMAIVL